MKTAETDDKYEKLLKPDELWALVDCNNFYASCEELFRPDLKDKPIVVLSNNDGCIVARSQKAKELGIPMGEPEFKIRSFLKLHNVAVFSSNYALYGDISTRVMHIIDEICPCEPYSIDEAFCRLKKSLAPNCLEIAKLLRERIQKWTGITCSVGIAPSKTLAKLANHIAKKENGIFILDPAQENFNELLKKIPVREIWGVGKKQSDKLRTNSIRTAYDYKSASEEWIQKNLTVTGLKTLRELHGVPCIETDFSDTPKSLVCSRSFGVRIQNFAELLEAVSSFTAQGAERLRRKNLLASGMCVHIRTSSHAQNYCKNTANALFPYPLCDTKTMLPIAKKLLEGMYRKNHAYVKAGIMFYGILPARSIQKNVFSLLNEQEEQNTEKLMHALDAINKRHGKHAIKFGAEGLENTAWRMKQEHKSPYNPRDIRNLPIAKLS